jgi:hypothetical protein
MWQISHLEQDTRLDGAVSAGQRAARFIRPGKVRDVLHGVWHRTAAKPRKQGRKHYPHPLCRLGAAGSRVGSAGGAQTIRFCCHTRAACLDRDLVVVACRRCVSTATC